MDFNYYKKYFTKNSIGRYDMAPIYTDTIVFNNLVKDIITPFETETIDKIISIDATGFIIGTAASILTNKGLVLIRKGGKIPLEQNRKLTSTFVDYSGIEKSLEIDKNMIKRNGNYLIIDDWIETGSQVKATIELIEELGGKVVGISTIGSDRNEKTEILFEKYNLKSIGVNV